MNKFLFWLKHNNLIFNPWSKYGLTHKCEMCGNWRFRLVECGFYWVCHKDECIRAANIQIDKDINEFHQRLYEK